MTRKMSVLAVVCALVLSGSLALPQQAGDAELAKGVTQAQEGDFENAVVTLDSVASRLTAAGGHGKELARAYLSVSYLGLSQQQKAKTQFLEAWKLDKGMELSASEFPPKVLGFLQQAEQGARAAAPSPAPPASPAQVASTTPHGAPVRLFAKIVVAHHGSSNRTAHGRRGQVRRVGCESATRPRLRRSCRGAPCDWARSGLRPVSRRSARSPCP